jgi:PAS domain S-box-containing protein
MSTAIHPSQTTSTHGPDKAITLALNLAQAERAVHAFAADEADAIMDSDGKTYLLRPAQEQLLRNVKRMEAMIEGVADVLTVVSRGGLILSQSRAVKHVFGYAPEEMIGKLLFDYIHSDDISEIHSAFFNVIEGIYKQTRALFRHRTKDGSYLLVEATTGLLEDTCSPMVIFSMRPITNPTVTRHEYK